MATSPEKRAAKGAAKKATPTKKATAAKPAAPPAKAKATKGTAAKATKPAKAPAKPVIPQKAPTKGASSAKKKVPTKAPGKAKAPLSKKPGGATGKMTVQEAKKKAATATRSKYWDRAQRRARSLLRTRGELLDVTKQAEKVAAKMRSGPMSKLIDQLRALLRLVRAYATGEYKDISWESMVLVVGALVYVVSPVDLIPDFIPVLGYLDDAAVVSFVLKIVKDELDEFIAWEKATRRGPKRRT